MTFLPRSRALALVAAALGCVALVAGCAKGGHPLEAARGEVAALSAMRSSLARPGAKEGRAGAELGARNLASISGLQGGLAFGKPRAGAETPLEQLLREGDRPMAGNGLCPPDMASIGDRFCVDKYEATLLEILPNGEERAWSPYQSVEGHLVRAISVPGVYPQGYISGRQAGEACARSGKRLCRGTEWRKACMGPEETKFGYGQEREAGRCNDHGRSAMGSVYGFLGNEERAVAWGPVKMNNPALNQVPGTLAKSGEHEGCTNGYGVYDMVGNLHEWVADTTGTFQGGYYLDTHLNGDGCSYKTTAHDFGYHDYSTGFRCCADVAP